MQSLFWFSGCFSLEIFLKLNASPSNQTFYFIAKGLFSGVTGIVTKPVEGETAFCPNTDIHFTSDKSFVICHYGLSNCFIIMFNRYRL